jgi:hypothetical protein
MTFNFLQKKKSLNKFSFEPFKDDIMIDTTKKQRAPETQTFKPKEPPANILPKLDEHYANNKKKARSYIRTGETFSLGRGRRSGHAVAID